MSYKNSIKKLNELFLSFIGQTNIDFKNSDLPKRLTKQTNSLNYTLFHIGSNMESSLSLANNQYNQIVEDSNKEKDNMFKMLNQEIDSLTVNFKKQKYDAIAIYNTKKDEILNNQTLLEQDLNYFNLTTSQTINVLKDEYEDNLKRYEYQIKNANEHYKETIDINNKNSNERLKDLYKKHINTLETYKIELKEIIEILQEQINNKNKEYTDLRSKLNDVKNNTKEKLLQESILLNDTIKILSNDKATSIDKAKEYNTKSISLFNAKKDNLHKDISLNVKNIQRDFVVNLSSLEDKLVTLKQKNENAVNDEKRRYQYELYELNKQHNNEVKNIIKDTYDSDSEERNAKKFIKYKNKQYLKLANTAKKNNNLKLKTLELNLLKDIEYNRYKRIVLELNKNAQLKKASEKEQFKNKAFQEEDNIFDIELKLAIENANKKYNQKANTVKCQNQIKNKALYKDLTLSESNFLKKLEMIETEINIKKAEIQEAYNLYELLCKYEEDKYKKTRQYYIVSSLLKTEKEKLLNEYNEVKYNQSIENALKLYEYTSNKFETENIKFETLTNLKFRLEENKLEYEDISLEFNNNKIDINEDKAKQLVFRRNQYILNNINQDTLNKRFNVEYECIITIVNTFTALTNQLYEYNERILKILYNSLLTDLDGKAVCSIRYMHIIHSYYNILVDELTSLLSEIVHRHAEFEEKFKYRQYYNSLLLNYETDKKKFLDKKKRFEETLINYQNTLEAFNNRIYGCQNEISMLTHRMKMTSQGKDVYSEQITKYNQLIKEHKNKIKDIEKMRKIINEDVEKTNAELYKLDISYNDRVEEIKALQHTNTRSYNNFKKNIDSFKNYAKVKIDVLNMKFNQSKFSENSFIKDYNETILKVNKLLESKIHNIISTFKNNNEELYKSNVLKNKTEYIKDCHNIKKKAENSIQNAINKNDTKTSNNQQEYNNIDNEIQRETNKFNSHIESIHSKNNYDNKKLISEQRIKLSDFYSNYNSLCDNIEEINNNFKQKIAKLEHDFHHEKILNTKNREKKVAQLNTRLNEFIKSKNEIISSLPGILKNESHILNKERRELNSSIASSIKESVNNFELQKKIINKNISIINDSLEQSNADIDKILQRDITKEKKLFTIKMLHFNKEFKKLKRGF